MKSPSQLPSRSVELSDALSIAIELIGRRELPISESLDRIAVAVGAVRLQWIETDRRDFARERRESIEIDWDLLAELAPGEVRRIDRQDRQRRPRLAAAHRNEVFVAAAGSAERVLRVLSDDGVDYEDEILRSLARLVGRVAEEEQSRRERVGEMRELQIGRRVATMTHDLRNQLNLALLQLSKASLSELGATHYESLEGILADARDMCRATLSHPERRATPKAIDLRRTLVDEASAAAGVARGSQHVGLSVRCPRGLQVLGERDALRRLIGNLILNSIEASSEGGEVRACAELTSPSRVVLEVSDRGRGMSADALEALFGAGASGAQGTGYGTTSFLENLCALDAEAQVESALGEGTKVRVLLRAVPEAGRRAVILCDRDGARRARWRSALEAHGIGCWEAEGPGDALGLLRCLASPLLVVARGGHGDELAALVERVRRERVPYLLVSSRDGGPQQILARPGMRAFFGGEASRP